MISADTISGAVAWSLPSLGKAEKSTAPTQQTKPNKSPAGQQSAAATNPHVAPRPDGAGAVLNVLA